MLDLIFMFGMVGLGAFIMVDGFISVITGEWLILLIILILYLLRSKCKIFHKLQQGQLALIFSSKLIIAINNTYDISDCMIFQLLSHYPYINSLHFGFDKKVKWLKIGNTCCYPIYNKLHIPWHFYWRLSFYLFRIVGDCCGKCPWDQLIPWSFYR